MTFFNICKEFNISIEDILTHDETIEHADVGNNVQNDSNYVTAKTSSSSDKITDITTDICIILYAKTYIRGGAATF